ncbi:MAG: SAM-dependent methyltransferase [Acidobacteria bacterium]|nr:SAM-dependent methyltransferase [Acidobacteriota bacterium]
MELCLYHPEFGYYAAERERFGKSGDFYTASDIHAVYGRLMARQFDEMWRALGSPPSLRVIELGPGRGLFAQDVLAFAREKFPAFFEAMQYVMVERSPSLCRRLMERFAAGLERGTVAVRHSLKDAESTGHAIAFANEFFDALPVDVLGEHGQLHIAASGNRFTETWREPAAAVLDYARRFALVPAGEQRVEICLPLEGIICELDSAFQRGFVIAVDYGYTRAELQAGAPSDTLRAFRSHTLRANVVDSPGEQDITADVNFTAVAELARGAGIHAMPLLRQSQFLMGIGEANQFADIFESCVLPQEHAKRALQLKHFITPEGLGEAFRVLVMFRGVPPKEAARLSGLKFAR